ncbi:MAG: SigB/SigF/SigG family RNA polymerase sigma factor [Clostridia bacterium]|nr:SigB/SigF/SigG family RNA polymerase sigma factor [Clostridia bacterium]
MQPDIYRVITKAKNGDMESRSFLVENNSKLVWSIVKRFLNRGHEAEDLFQVGCIGLIKAIDKFDTSLGLQFSTYAVPMITGEIKRFIRDDGIIKISRSIKETGIKAMSAREKLINTLNREPTVSEIADAVGVNTEDIIVAMEAYTRPASLNYTADGEQPLEQQISENTDLETESVDRLALKSVLSTFPKRERQIIFMRYFMDKTQSEIAKKLGISQVQVSRIEKRVLEQMRDKLS